jgi:hypothetical protein
MTGAGQFIQWLYRSYDQSARHWSRGFARHIGFVQGLDEERE